ncbi:MAG: hypothetical protein AAF492_29640, partial [Verrucomicrobiota bacterium]
RRDVIHGLVSVESEAATEALKQYVLDTWPRSGQGTVYLENYAGSFRRSRALAEVARRDSTWLADLALKEMASGHLAARAFGFDVFRQIIGHSFDVRPKAFAAHRKGDLALIREWWIEHRGQTREAWLLSTFRKKGFVMDRLGHPDSLPVLVEALHADGLTHNLAVEQISVITGKFFTEFRTTPSYQGPERMTIRVIGWLKARGYIEKT